MSKIYELTDSLPCKNFFNKNGVKFYSICGSAWFEANKRFLSKLGKKHYIFAQDWGAIELWENEKLDMYTKYMEYPENLIFLTNMPIVNEKRCEIGLNSILVNHNTFINTTIFNIRNKEKKYNMIINSRAKDWKRLHLASDMKNLALVINRWNIEKHSGRNVDDWKKLNYSYLNPRKLTSSEVSNIVNQSLTGGIFSAAEGACYSSSEYLLCGVPVISTFSHGGRDIYYNDYNSVICEPNRKDVLNCYEKLVREKKDASRIRNDHLKIIEEHENRLIKVFQNIFDENGISLNARKYYNKNKYDKNGRHFMRCEGCLKKIKDIEI